MEEDVWWQEDDEEEGVGTAETTSLWGDGWVGGEGDDQSFGFFNIPGLLSGAGAAAAVVV